jgi:hypothetical protein
MPYTEDLTTLGSHQPTQDMANSAGLPDNTDNTQGDTTPMPWLPYATAGAGGIGGQVIAGPAGGTAGGGLGWGLGKMVQDLVELSQGTYKKPANVKEAINQSMENYGQMAKAGSVTGLLGALYELLPWLSKGGLANITNQRVADASGDVTKDVPVVGEGGVVPQTQAAVEKKLGSGSDVIDALNKVLMQHSPLKDMESYTPLEGANLYAGQDAGNVPDELMSNPQDLLDTRRQVTNAYNAKNLFGNGNGLEQKVADAYRATLSQNLHEQVPSTKLPDLLYSLFSNKAVGQPLSWIPKIGGGVAVYEMLKKLLGGGTQSPWGGG